jgi:hypothetical protein
LSGVTRRRAPRLALVAIGAATLVTGCGTFDNTDVVAEVHGRTTIDTTQFESLADEYFGRPDLFGTQPAANRRVDADPARVLLSVLVQQQLFRGFLADYDVDATAGRKEYVDSLLTESPTFGELSPEFRDLVADADGQFRGETLTEVAVPNVDTLRSMYAHDPASLGLVCVRHILVETEAEARTIRAELQEGADFATLATERSTDSAAAASGGAIASSDNQCIPLLSVRQGFDPGFTSGVLAAREGVPSEPVESSFGWHVILHRPWDEISDSALELLRPGDVGGYLFDGRVATAQIDIDPRYGVWSPVDGAVIPAG